MDRAVAVTDGMVGAARPSVIEAVETLTLAVEGMHCGNCMRKVETALTALPGVSAARVNLSDRRVAALIQPSVISAEQLMQAIERAGFKAAELKSTSVAEGRTRDQDLLRRLAVAGFAAMNIMLLSVSVWAGGDADMPGSVKTLFHWLSALIALPAVAYAGQPFFRSAANALRVRRLNMDVPISLGVTLATTMSLYQTIRGSEQVYFDAAITLLAFLLLGRLLDEQMRRRASSAAANLLGLSATAASVIGEDGTVSRIALRKIVPGMRVLAAAGERIAVDGVVAAGVSEVDQSLITGESVPKTVKAGDSVFAGTVNIGQPLTVTVSKPEQQSVLAEIARLMTAAEQGRGAYVRLADRAARLYAPAVHVLGLSTFIGWMLVGEVWQDALTAAIAVLIITCPCALALAVPAVQVAAASRLFGKGIILKAADGLERLAEVDTIVLDKTGTLTIGEPRLANGGEVSDMVLAAAAGLAANSRHPYSRAIVAAAADRGLAVLAAAGVREVAGMGLTRHTPAGEERLGSAVWCEAPASAVGDHGLWYRPAGGNSVMLRFADQLREDAGDVIARLKAGGYRVELLSGDAPGPVATMAKAAGIDTFHAEVRPDGKIARLEDLKRQGRKVLMVGDGLNDAPALAAAHASLSPAAAPEISQTAADAVFQGVRLAPLIECLAVARAARRMSLQNFALAVIYNIVFVPLAMAGLVTPLIAAVAMSTSSITVTANAVRLRAAKLEVKA